MIEYKNIYITTPIYYVNGEPHIGHFYTTLASDVLIRLYLREGFDVRYLTGTDEHGQKVQQSADRQCISPQEFCDKVSLKFKQMDIDLDLIHSQNNFNNGKNWIRTTDKQHINFVQDVWRRLENNGWIYKGKYEGWYSVRGEAFFAENEIIDGKAPDGSDVKWQEEECYFFKLSVFQQALYEMYKNSNIIQPKGALNEMLSFLDKNNLKDLCVSRPKKVFDWGIEVPTDNNHTIYVWIDALFNDFSALGGDKSEEFNKYWLNGKSIHIMGKEIVRFHCVYWESLIYALYNKYDGENTKIDIEKLKQISPKQIFAHGWWIKDGEKMSKSLGNVISPLDELKWLETTFGIERNVAIDYFRYFLIASTIFGNDGDYSRKSLLELVNANLVNNIGNLVQRVCSMLIKNFEDRCKNIDKNYEKIHFKEEIKNIDFSSILQKIISEATKLNQEFDNLEPWTLIKGTEQDKNKAFDILSSFIPKILTVIDALEPICPHISIMLKENLMLTKAPIVVCKRILLS